MIESSDEITGDVKANENEGKLSSKKLPEVQSESDKSGPSRPAEPERRLMVRDMLNRAQPLQPSSEMLREATDALPLESEVPGQNLTAAASEQTNSVYVQQTTRFKRTEREQMQKILEKRKKHEEALDEPIEQAILDSMYTALMCQKCYYGLGLIVQGILAGFSSCHALFIVFFSPNLDEFRHLISRYAFLALPAHVFYYVALVICITVCLDRYDVGQSIGRVVWRALTLQSGGLSIVAYCVALVASLVSIPVEERMSLYLNFNQTHIIATELSGLPIRPDIETELLLWKIGAIFRAGAVLIGWLLIAIRPGTHLLHKHMLQADVTFREALKPAQSSPVIE